MSMLLLDRNMGVCGGGMERWSPKAIPQIFVRSPVNVRPGTILHVSKCRYGRR
jgi:hypothetical protein